MQKDKNWENLLIRYEDLFDTRWKDDKDQVYVFFGLVNASDDYYFGLSAIDSQSLLLVSCVCALELSYTQVF
jgi:hypothetical protein